MANQVQNGGNSTNATVHAEMEDINGNADLPVHAKDRFTEGRPKEKRRNENKEEDKQQEKRRRL